MRLIPVVLLLAITVSSCAQRQDTGTGVQVTEPTPSVVANETLTPDWAKEPVKDCKPVRGWCPGTYRGLTAGHSTFEDMVEILGQPTSSGPAVDQDDPKYYIWYEYGKISDGIIGRLGIVTDSRTNKIDYISIAPVEMKKQQAIDLFGPDFQEMGYTFCRGFDDDTSAPIYEDPDSTEMRYVEYRSRGMYFYIGFRDAVNEIIFASEPLGLASKKECKAVAKAK